MTTNGGWSLGVVSALVAGLGLAGCGNATPQAASDQPTVTATATVTATQNVKPPNKGKPHSLVGKKNVSGGSTFVMPDEVGKDLQASQDDLQALSGNMFFYSSSKDATGQSRFQILDVDWKVCSQRPTPGTILRDDADNVTFYVVKDWEHCP